MTRPPITMTRMATSLAAVKKFCTRVAIVTLSTFTEVNSTVHHQEGKKGLKVKGQKVR